MAPFAGVLCLQAQDRSADETIRVDTKLVSVPVIVSDQNGRYLPNLRQNDFSIFQDGVEQRIEFFAATEEPLTIAMLIDTSESTRDVLDDIKESAKSFVNKLKPRDQAMIVAFDYDMHILSPLTSDHERLKRAIDSAKLPEYLGTVLRDAVLKTVTKTFQGLTGRKAIILLTDGKDATSFRSSGDLFYALQESDTLIYPIMFETRIAYAGLRTEIVHTRTGAIVTRYPDDFMPLPLPGADPRPDNPSEIQNKKAQEFLRKLSDTTAGRFYSIKQGNLKKTFGMIVEELRHQYRLGFYPPEAAGGRTLHELKVKVARPQSVVRARGSYRTQSKPN